MRLNIDSKECWITSLRCCTPTPLHALSLHFLSILMVLKDLHCKSILCNIFASQMIEVWPPSRLRFPSFFNLHPHLYFLSLPFSISTSFSSCWKCLYLWLLFLRKARCTKLPLQVSILFFVPLSVVCSTQMHIPYFFCICSLKQSYN